MNDMNNLENIVDYACFTKSKKEFLAFLLSNYCSFYFDESLSSIENIMENILWEKNFEIQNDITTRRELSKNFDKINLINFQEKNKLIKKELKNNISSLFSTYKQYFYKIEIEDAIDLSNNENIENIEKSKNDTRPPEERISLEVAEFQYSALFYMDFYSLIYYIPAFICLSIENNKSSDNLPIITGITIDLLLNDLLKEVLTSKQIEQLIYFVFFEYINENIPEEQRDDLVKIFNTYDLNDDFKIII